MKKKKPAGISVVGEEYGATVFLINTKDQHGRPKLCTEEGVSGRSIAAAIALITAGRIGAVAL